MNNVNTVKEQAKQKAYSMAEDAKNTLQNVDSEEIKQSGKDWVNYIETHPLQSVLFGIIGYYALKGMMKN